MRMADLMPEGPVEQTLALGQNLPGVAGWYCYRKLKKRLMTRSAARGVSVCAAAFPAPTVPARTIASTTTTRPLRGTPMPLILNLRRARCDPELARRASPLWGKSPARPPTPIRGGARL